jgi:hypothetical protein
LIIKSFASPKGRFGNLFLNQVTHDRLHSFLGCGLVSTSTTYLSSCIDVSRGNGGSVSLRVGVVLASVSNRVIPVKVDFIYVGLDFNQFSIALSLN